jgi:hypothetical protein
MQMKHDFNRRTFLSAALATPALAAILAACANEIETAGNVIKHGASPDDVVLRVGFEGGFTAPASQFTRIPTVLISGDGRVIIAGAQIELYPGPLLPALVERSISEAGVQKVLSFADDSKLLQTPPDYSAEINVADVPDTVVIVSVNGQTYEHRAFALGMETPEQTPARVRLAGFVEAMARIETVAGVENLGPEKPIATDEYRIQARELTAEDLAGYAPEPDPTPQLVEWPSDAGVTLASAGSCAIVSGATVAALLNAATQLTFFTENAKTYQVAAIAKLPGDLC